MKKLVLESLGGGDSDESLLRFTIDEDPALTVECYQSLEQIEIFNHLISSVLQPSQKKLTQFTFGAQSKIYAGGALTITLARDDTCFSLKISLLPRLRKISDQEALIVTGTVDDQDLLRFHESLTLIQKEMAFGATLNFVTK